MESENLIFYFQFYIEDEEDIEQTEETFGFFVEQPNLGGTIDCDFIESFYDQHTFTLEEKYGVHDWLTSPVDGINAIGYTTYEVARKDIPALMEEWRQVFLTNFPVTSVSAVIEIPESYLTNDQTIHQFLKNIPLQLRLCCVI